MVNYLSSKIALLSVSDAFQAFAARTTILFKHECFLSSDLIYYLALFVVLEVTTSGFFDSFVSHLSSIDFVSIGEGSVLEATTL